MTILSLNNRNKITKILIVKNLWQSTIKRSYHRISSFSTLKLVLISRIFISHYVSKRSMFTIGTKISALQKEAAIKIAIAQKHYLQNTLSNIKTSNSSYQDFIHFTEQSLSINPKIAQHILTVTYPEKTIPLDILSKKYPTIGISDGNYNNKIRVNDLVASAIANKIKTEGLFEKGNLSVLVTPDSFKPFSKQVAYAQTGQPNPDYLYVYDKKTYIWSRYYDFKSGTISANKGHIFVTPNPAEFEEKARQLILAQFSSYTDYEDLHNFIKNLLKEKNLTWSQRNNLLHEYYLNNLQNYPNAVNPSLIFLNKDIHQIASQKAGKSFEGLIHSQSFQDLETSEKTLTKILIASGKTATENYINQTGVNKNIIKYLLEHMNDVI